MTIQFDLYGVVSSGALRKPNGEEYLPNAVAGVLRTACNVHQTLGICHNTSNTDLETLYALSHLAMRHALCVRNSVDVTFVEVGTWCGESAVIIACGALDAIQQFIPTSQKIHFRLAVVDTFEGTLTDLNRATNRRYGGSIREICEDNLRPLEFQQQVPHAKVTVEIIQGDSVEVAHNLDYLRAPSYVDLVNIDAGHTFAECYADIVAWNHRLLPGGYLMGHDYLETFPGVIGAADQACRELFGSVPIVPHDSAFWLAKKPLD